jgi:hypothetical protein
MPVTDGGVGVGEGGTRPRVQRWNKPAPLGQGAAADSVSAVAAPLLAGFALASSVIVADDADNFRYPGQVLLALAVAAALLVMAVQCGFWARRVLYSPADLGEWWPEMDGNPQLEARLAGRQEKDFFEWESWSMWGRRTYNGGIVCLLAGLGFALAPAHGAGVQPQLRWAAAGVAFAAAAGEGLWVLVAAVRAGRRSRRAKGAVTAADKRKEQAEAARQLEEAARQSAAQYTSAESKEVAQPGPAASER